MRRERFEDISFAPTELGIIEVKDEPFAKDLGTLVANRVVSGTKIAMWKPKPTAGNRAPGLLSLSGGSWGHQYAISLQTIYMLEDIVKAMRTDKDQLLRFILSLLH